MLFSLFYGSVFKNLANPSHMYYTSAMLNSRTKEGFFKNVVKFFFSRLRNFCFAVYFYLFVKFSGLFLPATLTRTRDVYPHPQLRPLPASRDPRRLGILPYEYVLITSCLSFKVFRSFSWERILFLNSACVNMVMQIQVQMEDTRKFFL